MTCTCSHAGPADQSKGTLSQIERTLDQSDQRSVRVRGDQQAEADQQIIRSSTSHQQPTLRATSTTLSRLHRPAPPCRTTAAAMTPRAPAAPASLPTQHRETMLPATLHRNSSQRLTRRHHDRRGPCSQQPLGLTITAAAWCIPSSTRSTFSSLLGSRHQRQQLHYVSTTSLTPPTSLLQLTSSLFIARVEASLSN